MVKLLLDKLSFSLYNFPVPKCYRPPLLFLLPRVLITAGKLWEPIRFFLKTPTSSKEKRVFFLIKTMNGNSKIQLTNEGMQSLKGELDELVNVKRPKAVERLSNARNQGDLMENSDYHNAKDELEFLDGRISELDDVLKNAEVVHAGSNGSGISVGTKVTLKVNGKEHVYHIVGEWEADPTQKKISHTSPLGQALIGKNVGEKVEVEAPVGKILYEILEIH